MTMLLKVADILFCVGDFIQYSNYNYFIVTYLKKTIANTII